MLCPQLLRFHAPSSWDLLWHPTGSSSQRQRMLQIFETHSSGAAVLARTRLRLTVICGEVAAVERE